MIKKTLDWYTDYKYRLTTLFILVVLLGILPIRVSAFHTSNPSTNPAQQFISCENFIDTAFISITIENCANQATICIEEAIGDMLSYTITDNGSSYSGGIMACDFDTAYAYTYSGIPDAGTNGPYFVDVWTIDGNSFSGEVADMAGLTDSMNTWDLNGVWNHDISTSSIRGGFPSNIYSNISITQISSGANATIERTTTLNPKGTSLTLETGFHQLIFTEPVEGCQDTLEVQIDCIPCSEIYNGISTFEIDNCSSSQAICFELSVDSLVEYEVFDNGSIYGGATGPCSLDSFYRYDYSILPGAGFSGPYMLQNWPINGSIFLGGFNTVADLLDSMNVWDPIGNWQISDPMQTISGGNPSNVYGDMQILQILTGTQTIMPAEQLASVTSFEMSLDTGQHEIVLLHTENNCSDTLNFEINCLSCPDYFSQDTMTILANHCDSSSAICLPFLYSDLNDFELTVNGSTYTGAIDSCATSEARIYLNIGNHHLTLNHLTTGCIDSTQLIIDCVPEVPCLDFITDSLLLIQTTDCTTFSELCIEIPFEEISDYTITDNGLPFSGAIEECLDGTAIQLTEGIHEIIFIMNASGCEDTLNTIFACTETEYIELSILNASTDTFCLDTSELPGDISTIENVCEQSGGELIIFEIDAINNCLIYSAVEAGIEQACLVVCDTYGFCDSTFFTIEVEELQTMLAPVANDDMVQALQSQILNIDILSNDEMNGPLDSLAIIANPENGIARITNDQNIEYRPNENYCSRAEPDSLVYMVCNETGCDLAKVYINVLCEEIIIHNAFSPNGDGINEYFIIQDAPTNSDNFLSVFNRWGQQIFSKNGYQNDWNGTWKNNDLPDGTYYYYYEDGNGGMASGYVLIQR